MAMISVAAQKEVSGDSGIAWIRWKRTLFCEVAANNHASLLPAQSKHNASPTPPLSHVRGESK
jgi:hypothetical protein